VSPPSEGDRVITPAPSNADQPGKGGLVARVPLDTVRGGLCLVCGGREPARARQVLRLLADGKDGRATGWLSSSGCACTGHCTARWRG